MADDNKKIELPDLMNELGEFGWYQFRQHCLHGLAWLLFGVHIMSFIFVFPVVEHRCYVKEIDAVEYINGTFLSENIPAHIPKNSKGNFESCLQYDNYNGTVHSCEDGYVYDYSIYDSSRVADWDLVCDRIWMRALLQSIFLIGCLVGCSTCGRLSDKFGRKPVFCVSGVMQLVVGVAGAFITNYYAFAFSMFWYGFFGAAGAVVPSVALTMELVGPSMRPICGTLLTVWFNIGGIIVALLPYFFPLPASILQLIYASTAVILCAHFWLMDESICWLWTNGKKDKAIEIIQRVVKSKNKEASGRRTKTYNLSHQEWESQFKTVCENVNNNIENVENIKLEGDAPRVWDLFKFPKLRKRTLIMLYIWPATSLAYFGLSFNSVNLVGNPHMMFILNILVEMPAHVASTFVQRFSGNKILLIGSMLYSGTACIVLPSIKEETISVLLAMIAKIAATVTFNILNSYTAELFPTCLRNTALGICMMAARLGAALIPGINLLSVASEGIPTMTFGVTAMIGAFLAIFFLPETLNRTIPQTIQDVETSRK